MVGHRSMQRADPSHERDVEVWRRQRLERLTADDGWLVVEGLFWLHPGDNRFGSGRDQDLVLPANSAPSFAGGLRSINMTPGQYGPATAWFGAARNSSTTRRTFRVVVICSPYTG